MSVAELLECRAGLEIESLDRIYLNGYVPKLQVSGQVVSFMTDLLKLPIPSPAVMQKIGNRFRREIQRFAEDEGIPLIRFSKGERKIDRVRSFYQAAERQGRTGVVAIGQAQEFQNVFACHRREDPMPSGVPWFNFTKADRRVSCFYFYLLDEDFGECFVKICAYSPYPVKVWCNGHEWAKRQARRRGIGFAPLSNPDYS